VHGRTKLDGYKQEVEEEQLEMFGLPLYSNFVFHQTVLDTLQQDILAADFSELATIAPNEQDRLFRTIVLMWLRCATPNRDEEEHEDEDNYEVFHGVKFESDDDDDDDDDNEEGDEAEVVDGDENGEAEVVEEGDENTGGIDETMDDTDQAVDGNEFESPTKKRKQ